MQPVLNARDAVTYESPTPDHRQFRVLVERDISGSESVAAGQLWLPAGASQPGAESHSETEEIYYCARGTGRLVLDDEDFRLEEGTMAYVGRGVRHQVFNDSDGDLLLIWFESPPSCEVGGYKPMKLNWPKTSPPN